MKKKPYVFKKSDAIAKSDPMACFHSEDKFWETLDKCEAINEQKCSPKAHHKTRTKSE